MLMRRRPRRCLWGSGSAKAKQHLWAVTGTVPSLQAQPQRQLIAFTGNSDEELFTINPAVGWTGKSWILPGFWQRARNCLQRGQKSSREKKCVVLNALDNQCPRCPFLTVLNSLKSQLFECPYGLNSRRNRNVFSDLPPMSSSPLVVWGLLRFQHLFLSMTRFGVFYLCRHHVLHRPVEILHSSWSWKGHGWEPSRTSWEKYFLSIVAFHQKLRCFGWTLVHKPSADWESLLLVFSLLFSRPTNLF